MRTEECFYRPPQPIGDRLLIVKERSLAQAASQERDANKHPDELKSRIVSVLDGERSEAHEVVEAVFEEDLTARWAVVPVGTTKLQEVGSFGRNHAIEPLTLFTGYELDDAPAMQAQRLFHGAFVVEAVFRDRTKNVFDPSLHKSSVQSRLTWIELIESLLRRAGTARNLACVSFGKSKLKEHLGGCCKDRFFVRLQLGSWRPACSAPRQWL